MVYLSGDDKLDGVELPKALRALNFNPSLDWCVKNGGAEKKGQKFITLDEFYKIVVECKKDKKDQGVYEDFIECLKLYDKADDGRMMASELSHALGSLGERMKNEEVDEVLDDCLDEEDDEGMIPYTPFLARMCGKQPPLKVAKK
ncbi:myosin light chain alkali-like [Agrilus planipennis]|uniref:Myosin light chain alkali n=1 Tax=Agrilus planipennis TaxID=224129 RepID=A0A1W4WN26_AGRPL|nr:myosin light chain alkali-like [Agrilus planipennis]